MLLKAMSKAFYRVMNATALTFALLPLGGSIVKAGEPGLIKPPTDHRYSTLTKAEGVKYNRFKKAFEKSWRQYKFDNASDDETYERARIFVDPLPVWDVGASCDGQELFWFNFAEYRVLSKKGQVVDLGGMYTGSAGTEGILFGLDKKTNKLKILFRENVLDLLGENIATAKSGLDCPELTMAFSGFHFKKAKNNYDSGLDIVSYQRRTKKYVAKRIRLKEPVTPDDKDPK